MFAVPRQNNGYDCGVYVSSFASVIYGLFQKPLSIDNVDTLETALKHEFQNFNELTCPNIREDTKVLFQKLAEIYEHSNPKTVDPSDDEEVIMVKAKNDANNDPVTKKKATKKARKKTKDDVSVDASDHDDFAKQALTPVPPEIMQTYAEFRYEEYPACAPYEPTVYVQPGCKMKIGIPPIETTLIDIHRGKLLYGPKAGHVFIKSLFTITNMHLSLQDCKTHEWVEVSPTVFLGIMAQRMPSRSRELLAREDIRKNAETISDSLKRGWTNPQWHEDAVVYGKMDDPVFRSILRLAFYPRKERAELKIPKEEKEGINHCIICSKSLPLHRISLEGKGMIPSTRKALVNHVNVHHKHIPFAFLEQLTRLRKERNTNVDVKSLVQESLRKAYIFFGIESAIVFDVYVTRDDRHLKMRLSKMFSYAASYANEVLPNNLKKRSFLMKWMKQEPLDYKEDARKSVLETTLQLAVTWIMKMEESCELFDFVTFIDLHKGNWLSVWNSLLLFFERGLFFDKVYPPVNAIEPMISKENPDIMVEMERCIQEMSDSGVDKPSSRKRAFPGSSDPSYSKK